jgi:predicted PurR-regulated permease PerM
MDRILKVLATVFGLAVIIFLAWEFSTIVTYILIAAVLSIMGNPLVRLLDKIRVKKWKMPHSLSSFITLLIIILVIVGIFSIFVPLIANQAEVVSKIDITQVSKSFEDQIQNLQVLLVKYNIIEKKDTLEALLIQNLESIVNFATFSDIFTNLVGLAGSLFIAIFSVFFITFFFLKEENMFFNAIMLLIPLKYQTEGQKILSDSRRLLSRYFVGLLVELTTMVTLISTGLTIFGVEGAFLIGFLGGIMNVIPYLGPIIGATIGVILGTISHLSTGNYDVLILILTIIGTFSVANLIDNIVLQPWIYSSSVKAHPLEIFLVILIAGSVAGVIGMMLAIPAYTVIRIITKQFLKNSRIVQKLTQGI